MSHPTGSVKPGPNSTASGAESLTLRASGADTGPVPARRALLRRLHLGIGCAVLLGLAPVAVASLPPIEEAAQLHARAVEAIRQDSFESRRVAMEALERATLLAPDSIAYQLELARLYYRMGFLGRSRERYRRVEEARPDLADGYFGQGLAWRRDYLKYLDRGSLHRAVDDFTQAASRSPRWC